MILKELHELYGGQAVQEGELRIRLFRGTYDFEQRANRCIRVYRLKIVLDDVHCMVDWSQETSNGLLRLLKRYRNITEVIFSDSSADVSISWRNAAYIFSSLTASTCLKKVIMPVCSEGLGRPAETPADENAFLLALEKQTRRIEFFAYHGNWGSGKLLLVLANIPTLQRGYFSIDDDSSAEELVALTQFWKKTRMQQLSLWIHLNVVASAMSGLSDNFSLTNLEICAACRDDYDGTTEPITVLANLIRNPPRTLHTLHLDVRNSPLSIKPIFAPLAMPTCSLVCFHLRESYGFLSESEPQSPPTTADFLPLLEHNYTLRHFTFTIENAETPEEDFEMPSVVDVVCRLNRAGRKRLFPPSPSAAPATTEDWIRVLAQVSDSEGAIDWLLRKNPTLVQQALEAAVGNQTMAAMTQEMDHSKKRKSSA